MVENYAGHARNRSALLFSDPVDIFRWRFSAAFVGNHAIWVVRFRGPIQGHEHPDDRLVDGSALGLGDEFLQGASIVV